MPSSTNEPLPLHLGQIISGVFEYPSAKNISIRLSIDLQWLAMVINESTPSLLTSGTFLSGT